MYEALRLIFSRSDYIVSSAEDCSPRSFQGCLRRGQQGNLTQQLSRRVLGVERVMLQGGLCGLLLSDNFLGLDATLPCRPRMGTT
ncbi:MAG: hypothetical protein JWR10_880 [Rubritepida sp.]|nr:hypothetical protein [Rubritepida sp.]